MRTIITKLTCRGLYYYTWADSASILGAIGQRRQSGLKTEGSSVRKVQQTEARRLRRPNTGPMFPLSYA